MVTDSQLFSLPESFDCSNDVRMPNPEHSPPTEYGFEIGDSPLSIDLHNYVVPPSPDFGTLARSLYDSPGIGDREYDSVFEFINHVLIEENTDENPSIFHDRLALQATEKSFYDVIDMKYPPSPSIRINTESPKSLCERIGETNENSVDPSCSGDAGNFNSSVVQSRSPDQSTQSSLTSSQPLVQSLNSSFSNSGGQIDPFTDMHLVPSIFSGSETMMHFRKGMEEAMKFLPTSIELVFNLDKYTWAPKSKKEPTVFAVMKNQFASSRGRKHLHSQDSSLDARSRKQSAVYEVEVEELSELFDKILLRNVGGVVSVSSTGYLKYLNGIDKYWQQNELFVQVSGNKKGAKIDAVHLQSLLVSCAQALASNDVQTAHIDLKQIRQYASSTGDACQRTANVFANGLEARLAGTGTQLYAELACKKISATEELKSYQFYLSACPFIENSRVFANKMILKIAATASTLHIVDFGISYGFQWPTLIQFLSIREGGPPKLRITGIDFPQAGFRPAILIEQTGQRLAKYCKRFNVPFEYQTIARQSWETIDINDLKLARDELLVVNCMFMFQNLPEESEVVESPKDRVLKLIRTMKPDLFVHSIVNGSYSTPFFVSRFRETFFYYSSLFDMLDVALSLSHDDLQRLNFEKYVYGREVVNIIACEGKQRVVRPESYKQWQIRTRRAGFEILPLDMINVFKSKIVASYHKDFLFIEDCDWMLQGWKGRVLYGTSCWVPV